MLIPYDSRFEPWKYVEVAAYIPRLKTVIRPKEDGENTFLEWGEELLEFRDKHHSKGIYTSALRFKEKDLGSPRLGCLYFDFDDEADPFLALKDARSLFVYMREFIDPQHIRTYFTGAKGFHIEVEPLPMGVSPVVGLSDHYGYIAKNLQAKLELKTLDGKVYDSRRMWRLVNTVNQKTGLYKVELDRDFFLQGSIEQMQEYATQPRGRMTPSNLDLNLQANEWYREYLAQHEEELEQERQELARRKAELFSTYGTSLARKTSRKKMHATWDRAIEALKNSEANKNRNNTLSVQGYTVFLTALEGDYDPDDYFVQLIDIGLGIGLEEREVKATLRSSLRAATKKYEASPKQLA